MCVLSAPDRLRTLNGVSPHWVRRSLQEIHYLVLESNGIAIWEMSRDLYSIPFHRFISGNEAHTDETRIRQEDRESVGLQRKRIEAQKTQKHTVKQRRQKYTFKHLEATLPKHYYSHSNAKFSFLSSKTMSGSVDLSKSKVKSSVEQRCSVGTYVS